MNEILAATPPTVTVTGKRGCGRLLRGVPFGGEAPVASVGVTSPSPVMKMVIAWPACAVATGIRKLLESTKVAGAAICIGMPRQAICPLLLTATTAVPIAVSYGIWMSICAGETE